MSSLALSGVRGPVCPDLPPTLLPHAIAASAPPRDRARSMLLAGAVYCFLAGGGLLLSRAHPQSIHYVPRTDRPPIVVELDPLHQPSAPTKVLPPPALQPVSPLTAQAPVSETLPEDPGSVIPTGLPSEDLGNTRPAHTLPTGSMLQVPGVVGGTGTAAVQVIDASAVQILRQVAPVYPSLARQIRAQGTVVLQMTIDASGVPTDVQMVEGLPVFREEALRAARLWRFEPARVDGRPVPATFKLTLNFRLR